MLAAYVNFTVLEYGCYNEDRFSKREYCDDANCILERGRCFRGMKRSWIWQMDIMIGS
jgi:hypothetical protein